MNPDPQCEVPLTIQDLFRKASFHLASSSANNGQQQGQVRIVTFQGQVVHFISATNLSASKHTATTSVVPSISVPSDPLRYPLQQQALQFFKKKGNGAPPDYIIWLAPPLPQEHTTDITHTDVNSRKHRRSVSKESRTTPAKGDRVMIVLSSDDEQHDNDKAKTDDQSDNSSAVSWSDSAASDSEMERGSGQYNNDNLPEAMVAVLISRSFDQSSQDFRERFRRGDVVHVNRAAMLYGKMEGHMVISCVGVPGKTTFKVIPAPRQPKKRTSRVRTTSRSAPSEDWVEDRISWTATAQLHSTELGNLSQQGSKKRTWAISESVTDDESEAIEPASQVFSYKKTRQSSRSPGKARTPLLSLRPQLAPNLNPLDLLVRVNDSRVRSSVSHRDGIVYFSNLWSDTFNSSSISCVSTPTSSISSANISAQVYGVSGSSSSSNVDNPCEIWNTTRHICWLTKIHSVRIRAVCAECANDYKNLECVFGCRSRKWRLEIRMKCTVSDGTAEVELRVQDDQEKIMWTLLGLMLKSSASSSADNESTSQPIDPFDKVRNKVLRILARRGEFSFKAATPRSHPFTALPTISTTNKNSKAEKGRGLNQQITSFEASGKDHVDSIGEDQTQRAKMEEQLWLDICTARPEKRESFLLYATTSTPDVASALVAGKSAKLKKTRLWMNRQTAIETLVRPPFVLRAVDIEWIRPQTEARILLKQLHSVHP
ncbi:hypothetical protein BGZ51_001023 [Haplosporangium sp. Z 767]|nr:hypothetical protein BGZ51_001023 [Haplosporangium sp. Z 767]